MMIFLYVVAGYFVCKWLLRCLCVLCVGLLCHCAVRRRKRLPESQQSSSNEVRDSHVRQSVVRYLFGMVRLVVYQTARIPSHCIRNLIYRHILCLQMDAGTTVYYGTEFRDPWKIHLGTGTIIGDQCVLDGRNGINIGQNVNFSTGVWIWTMQHDYNATDFGLSDKGMVTIGDRAWLGPRCVILPGVNIGEGAVVAAGAVVTKDIPPYTLFGGIPARQIGVRNTNLTYEFDAKGHAPYL